MNAAEREASEDASLEIGRLQEPLLTVVIHGNSEEHLDGRNEILSPLAAVIRVIQNDELFHELTRAVQDRH